jgi:glycogen debranching enzyme
MPSPEPLRSQPADVSAAAAPVGQYYISVTHSLQERRPRTLKHGDTFAVFDHNGDVVSEEDGPEGVYHADTRHLSHFDLLLGGNRPMLLSSVPREDNASLTCDLANPDVTVDGQVVLERDLVHVRRSKFLWNATAFERIVLRSFSDRPHDVSLEMRFEADFADLFEVRGTKRTRRGRHLPPEVGNGSVRLAYLGLDDRLRRTVMRFDPAPALLHPSRAVYGIHLPPYGRCILFVEVICDNEPAEDEPRRNFLLSLRDSRRALMRSTMRAASVATSNDIFNEVVRRSVADLYMLITDKPEGPYPYAGIPWFSTVFGRDAIITALEMLWLDPQVARGVLRYLAANQATKTDAIADAEPGKILHEQRRGEMAELGEVPFRHYYGSVDSTPLFVLLASEYLERTGDLATIRAIWPNIVAALGWIDRHGDRDGDGFVEYHRHTKKGLLNQGWKDSHDSIFHADGSFAEGPIALCEVQAYVFGAKHGAAKMARLLGDVALGDRLNHAAEALRQRFEEAFWSDALGTYALALDGAKRPCLVRSSNAGHVLFTGMASPERAARVARTLMDSATFSGWGVRTIASTEPRYNPMAYHNGSVWPHDNAMIALGLSRYGLLAEAARIFKGLFDASIYIDLRRLPELFCGFARRKGRGPTSYPVACSPQAWAAAAPLALMQACLGLRFDPENSTIRFEHPVLPDFLDEVTLRRLAVGGAEADLLVRRDSGRAAVSVLRGSGGAKVVTTN